MARVTRRHFVQGAVLRTIPIVMPTLFVVMTVSVGFAKHALRKILNEVSAEPLNARRHFVNDVEFYFNVWISYVCILDTFVLIAVVLSSGLARNLSREVLRRAGAYLCIDTEPAYFAIFFASAWLCVWIALAFGAFCAGGALLVLLVRVLCKESTLASKYAVAFVAQQLDKKSPLRITFCATNLTDDALEYYEALADDDIVGDDASCLSNLDDFCDPFIHHLHHNTVRLAASAAIMSVIQIHVAILAIERFRYFAPPPQLPPEPPAPFADFVATTSAYQEKVPLI